jgi:hypothetical protein
LACIVNEIVSSGLKRKRRWLGWGGGQSASAKSSRGGRWNSTIASVAVVASALPARMKKGAPAQRQLSTSSRSATKVSTSESGATPGSSR